MVYLDHLALDQNVMGCLVVLDVADAVRNDLNDSTILHDSYV